MKPEDRDQLVKRMRLVNWAELSEAQLGAIDALIAGRAAPVACIAPDGTPCEVCVVCGDLLIPRPQPRCEGCPDPEDVESADLHIQLPPLK